MRAPRILFTSSARGVGGGETNLLALISTLDTERFRPYLFYDPASPLHEYLPPGRATLIPFVLPPFRYSSLPAVFAHMMRMAYLVLRHRIDVIYANTHVDLKFILPIKRVLPVKVIAHIHSEVDDTTLRWLSIDQCDRVIFPSESQMHRSIEGSTWVDARRFLYLHNAIDNRVYYPRETAALRHELGIPAERKIIGMMATLKRAKGQSLLIKAARRLADLGIEAEYVFAGADPRPDQSYLADLTAQTHALGIAEHVHFLGNRRDVPELMSLFDLLVLPSLRETFGRVIVEAMACGTPVVVSALECVFEIFENGRGGLMVQLNDVDSLTEKIRYFFEHPEFWEEQKRYALEIGQHKFRQEDHTRAVEALFTELVSGR